MRFLNRHLAGALLVVASLSFVTHAEAQECQGCQTCQADSTCVADGAGGGHAGSCQTCADYRPYAEASQPDLFYNVYVPNNLGAAAAAYPAPYPTPNSIGHTYYTYQPLMPQEFLYHHHRTYHQYYNRGMGLNRTTVRWHGTPMRTGLKGVHKFISLPR